MQDQMKILALRSTSQFSICMSMENFDINAELDGGHGYEQLNVDRRRTRKLSSWLYGEKEKQHIALR